MGKWQSRKWWVCLWSMACSSAIIASGIIRGEIPEGLGAALTVLIGVVGGYLAANAATKPRGE